MRRISGAAAVVLLLLVTGAAKAERGNSRRGDEQAIRAQVASFAAAFNKGDAAAVADHWTPDGDLVTAAGEMIKGRQAIARQFERFLADLGPSKLKSKVLSIRFLTPDVAIEDSTSELEPPPIGPPMHAHHTTVFVKRDAKWLIASARGSITFPPSNYDHLQSLEWMIGDWNYVHKATGEHIYTTCRWSENKNYIIRQYRLELNATTRTSGTTRIGWDPAEKKIKSWIFDDDGSIFQGTWSRDGKRWLVRESGALRDGTPAQATHVLTPIDATTFQFQSIDRKLNGKPEPDIDPVQLSRRPPRR